MEPEEIRFGMQVIYNGPNTALIGKRAILVGNKRGFWGTSPWAAFMLQFPGRTRRVSAFGRDLLPLPKHREW